RLLRVLYDGLRTGAVPQHQHRGGFGIAVSRQAKDNAIFHLRLSSQRRFKVLGIDVHAGRRNDDVFLSSLEIKIAVGIEFSEITGAIPTFLARNGLKLLPIPISGGNTAAAYQNFIFRAQLDLTSGENFADRSFAQAKRMINADDRGSLGKPVALNDGESEPSPEVFRHAVERRASGDEGPELPSELAVDATESPPPAQ